MRMGPAQLVCLILGVLFVSVGGGMLGGRLIAQKSDKAVVSHSTGIVQGLDTIAPIEPPSLLPWAEPEPRENANTSANGGAKPAGSALAEGVAPAKSPTIDVAPTAAAVEQPGAALKKPAAVAEPPAAKPEMQYVIQTISTSSRSDALAARKRIMAQGFSAGIFEANIPGKGTWYRVYVGPYEAEAEAQAALKTIHDIPGFEESFLKTLE